MSKLTKLELRRREQTTVVYVNDHKIHDLSFRPGVWLLNKDELQEAMLVLPVAEAIDRARPKDAFVQLCDGDSVEIPSGKFMNFKCCSCGVVHKITTNIDVDNKTTTLSFEEPAHD
jgi:transcription antitermination factor NusG